MKKLEDLTVLIVEDDPGNRLYLVKRLERAGVGEVLETDNLADAKSFISVVKLDLILCDWYLGAETGLDLLEEARKLEATRDVPFILVTGEKERVKVKEALSKGVTDYLVKPFSAEILMDKIRVALSNQKITFRAPDAGGAEE